MLYSIPYMVIPLMLVFAMMAYIIAAVLENVGVTEKETLAGILIVIFIGWLFVITKAVKPLFSKGCYDRMKLSRNTRLMYIAIVILLGAMPIAWYGAAQRESSVISNTYALMIITSVILLIVNKKKCTLRPI